MKIFFGFIWLFVSVLGICVILFPFYGFEKPKCVHVYVGVEKEEVYSGSISMYPKTIVCIRCYHTIEQKVKPLPNIHDQLPYHKFLDRLDSMHSTPDQRALILNSKDSLPVKLH